MDDFSYSYPLTSGKKTHNKLDHVDDNVPGNFVTGDLDDQNPGNYSYDAIGNIVSNAQEEIEEITWDLYNKIRSVERTSSGSNNDLLADLRFWYDGAGNRVRKRVIQPLVGGGADTTDTWYVRDPQGNPMAIYEQEKVVDTLFTKVSEFAIYGAERTSSSLSARIGLCYAGLLLSRECSTEACTGLGDDFDPTKTQRALMVSEVMYDSPLSPDTVLFEQVHDGEYILLTNTSGREMDLDSIRIVCNGDTLALSGTLAAEGYLVVGFAGSNAEFEKVTRLDTAAEGQRLVLNQSLELSDGGGEIEVWNGKTLVDRVNYGEFHALVAENDYISDSLLDSLSQRGSLTSLLRRAVGPPIVGGSGIGQITISGTIQGEPIVQSWQGRYGMHRGRKAFEGTNHLGNVLSVVSDRKIGLESGALDTVVDFYVADLVSLSDYWPGACPERGTSRRGAPLQERQYSAKDYRYGFNGKESDPKWMGKGNAIDYGFRVQDARVGRFLSVDPLAPEYPWYTPYQFAGNTPIVAIDIEGLEPASKAELEMVITKLQKITIRDSKHWPNIAGTMVKDQLLARLENSKIIYQGKGWNCGTAFIERGFVTHDPQGFVDAVLDIYAEGNSSKKFSVPSSYPQKKPSFNERYGEHEIDNMPVVDFLFISTVRYTFNDGFLGFFFPLPEGPKGAGTFPGEIKAISEMLSNSYNVEEVDKSDLWAIYSDFQNGFMVGLLANFGKGKKDDMESTGFSPREWYLKKKGKHYVFLKSMNFIESNGNLMIQFTWWDYGDRNPKLNKKTYSLEEWDQHVKKVYKFEKK